MIWGEKVLPYLDGEIKLLISSPVSMKSIPSQTPLLYRVTIFKKSKMFSMKFSNFASQKISVYYMGMFS